MHISNIHKQIQCIYLPCIGVTEHRLDGKMMHHITKINKVGDDFSLICEFNNKEIRLIDLSEWVNTFRKANDGWASKLADINYFKTVKLDSYGTLVWDNQVDFCPDVLYEMSSPEKTL
jgi:hypothetical protein